MLHHQGDHHDSHGTGRTRDHARPATEYRCDQAHHEGGIEADHGCHASHEGKSHGLGDQGQGNGQTGEDIVFDTLLAGAGQLEHGIFRGYGWRKRRSLYQKRLMVSMEGDVHFIQGKEHFVCHSHAVAGEIYFRSNLILGQGQASSILLPKYAIVHDVSPH